MTTEEFKSKQIAYNRAAHYVDKFLGMRCAADLLAARLFPNGKEISESMAALAAIRKHVCPLGIDTNDTSVALVVVGDGIKPKTAALFAFMTKWQCFSIDPLLAEQRERPVTYNGVKIDRLQIIPKLVQELRFDLTRFDHVIICMVHSHATTQNVLDGLVFRIAHVVAIPCCVAQEPMSKQLVEYTDEAIWSPKNRVIVSLNVVHPTYSLNTTPVSNLRRAKLKVLDLPDHIDVSVGNRRWENVITDDTTAREMVDMFIGEQCQVIEPQFHRSGMYHNRITGNYWIEFDNGRFAAIVSKEMFDRYFNKPERLPLQTLQLMVSANSAYQNKNLSDAVAEQLHLQELRLFDLRLRAHYNKIFAAVKKELELLNANTEEPI